MYKEKMTPAAHEMRDRPVPPVKGAVTDRQDAILRPEGMMAPSNGLQQELPTGLDSWL